MCDECAFGGWQRMGEKRFDSHARDSCREDKVRGVMARFREQTEG